MPLINCTTTGRRLWWWWRWRGGRTVTHDCIRNITVAPKANNFQISFIRYHFLLYTYRFILFHYTFMFHVPLHDELFWMDVLYIRPGKGMKVKQNKLFFWSYFWEPNIGGKKAWYAWFSKIYGIFVEMWRESVFALCYASVYVAWLWFSVLILWKTEKVFSNEDLSFQWSAWVMNQALFLPQYQCFQKFRLCIRHALVLENCLLLSGVCLPTSWVQMYALFFGLCKPLKINILKLVQGASYIYRYILAPCTTSLVF